MTGILDLGPIAPPLLLFGGPYGNLQAARAIRREAGRRRLTAGQVICTGDVVAYCGDPAATVALIRDWEIPVVQGNVEEQIGENAADCGCGFAEGSACEALSRSWYAGCVAALDPDAARWMAGLPRVIRFEVDGVRFAAIHGGAEQVNRFVFASTPADELAGEIAALEADVVIAGHSGIPFTRRIGGAVWHNAGVVGMPANDGTPDVWFSTIERGDGGLVLAHRRLSYDHAAAAAAMRANGFPESYARALGTGLWPSLDILPGRENAETGIRLDPAGAFVARPSRIAAE